MSQPNVCDYSDYDYKSEFWTNQNRDYEHQLEVTTIRTLLTKYGKQQGSICDAGCGFGRLIDAYKPQFNAFHLVDYADTLLAQAKNHHGSDDRMRFYQQSLYELNLPTPVDAIISIRTLHHLDQVDVLFQKFYQNLSPQGILVLDIPNHYHIKNKLKSPFKPRSSKTQISPNYYNYNPTYIIEKLKKTGFNIIDQRQIGLFRIGLIKRIFPPTMLISLESQLNRFIKSFNIAPSVYIVAKKHCG